MDSRTRVLTALAHEKPDRPPFNFWMDRRLMAKYEERIGHRHWRVTHYDADVIETFPYLPFPAGKFVEHTGTQWMSEPYPMSWDRIDDIPMPDPHADDVFHLMMPDLQEFPDRACVMNMATPWSVIANMRGYEQVYLDICDRPEAFKALARKINDVMKIMVDRACRLDITALYIQEDVASAKGLSMAPAAIDEFCFDYARELADVAREHGKPTLFHCCGKIMDLMDRFVAMGVAAVNPLQPHLNDLADFKARYGDRLALYGGLDNCYIISQGTAQEVRAHVLDVFDTVGRPDGALIFSTHDIDIDCPPENIEAMVQTIKHECRFNGA